MSGVKMVWTDDGWAGNVWAHMGAALDYRQRVGRRIRRARLQSGLSQTALAQRVGVADKQVSRWEHGQLPRPSTLERIAAVLDVPSEWFFRTDD